MSNEKSELDALEPDPSLIERLKQLQLALNNQNLETAASLKQDISDQINQEMSQFTPSVDMEIAQFRIQQRGADSNIEAYLNSVNASIGGQYGDFVFGGVNARTPGDVDSKVPELDDSNKSKKMGR